MVSASCSMATSGSPSSSSLKKEKRLGPGSSSLLSSLAPHWQPSRPASRSYESHSQPYDSWKLTLDGLYQPCVLPYHSPWRFHGVSVHKRPLSTAAAAAKSGRPQRTLGTRLERQKRGNPRFSARKKPASPLFLPLGQLPTWFLGRYLSKGFVLLPGVARLRI